MRASNIKEYGVWILPTVYTSTAQDDIRHSHFLSSRRHTFVIPIYLHKEVEDEHLNHTQLRMNDDFINKKHV